MKRVIWQYWETRGTKPVFIDGLLEIARKNAGVDIIQVTPETLPDYLPDMPPQIYQIQKMAHKADMIRTLLVQKHGGMWLDSDAIVLQDLNWLFDLLNEHEFVGFDDVRGEKVRVNCFLSRPEGKIISEWTRQQHDKFPKVEYEWEEIGSDILHPICQRYPAKILPFERICPVQWYEVLEFSMIGQNPRKLQKWLEDCIMVMLTNNSLSTRNPKVREQSIEEMAAEHSLISHFIRKALDKDYRPSSVKLYAEYLFSWDANRKRLKAGKKMLKHVCQRADIMEYKRTGGL